jgi:hypothetical protein
VLTVTEITARPAKSKLRMANPWFIRHPPFSTHSRIDNAGAMGARQAQHSANRMVFGSFPR